MIRSAVGPDGSFKLPFQQEFNELELSQIEKGTRFRFYVWGSITYDDVYGDSHQYEYVFSYGGTQMLGTGGLHVVTDSFQSTDRFG